MTGRPPRYGDDTWYAVIGYEGDPHILAYRREHPDHITVPLRWKNPPEPRNTKTATPRPASRASFQLPHPDDMLTVAEFKAIMAEARAATPPARQPDDLLIPIQNSRGPRGPRPPGARRDWTPLELWNQHRIDNARTRLAEIEPRNPMLQSLEPSGTPPTPRMADAMEAELLGARERESRGEPGRGGTRADTTGEESPRLLPSRSNRRNEPGTASFTLLPRVTDTWLRGSDQNLGLVPAQIAERLSGQTFANFRTFRERFWKEVANTPELARQFDKLNVARMSAGQAPLADRTQRFGRQTTYELHHRRPLGREGNVYDMDNIIVVTPLMHRSILAPSYHYRGGDR